MVDFKTAFLNGAIDCELFMELPPGFGTPGKVALLKKTVYGLKQAANRWYDTLQEELVSMGFECLEADRGVFVRGEQDTYCAITIHVDDLLLFGPSKQTLQKVKDELFSRFKPTDLGPISQFLGQNIVRVSVTGYSFELGGALISWASRKQELVTLSTTEAEYVAMNEAGKEAAWLVRLMEQLGSSREIFSPVQLNADNMGGIRLSKNPEYHRKTKHIGTKWHWIRRAVKDNLLTISHVPSEDNHADGFTKPLAKVKFGKFLKQLNMEG